MYARRLAVRIVVPAAFWPFALQSPSLSRNVHSNRVFPPLKRTAEFDDLILMSTSQNVPIIANFGAAWCPSCRTFTPVLESTVEEEAGRISVVRVEIDEPECAELATRYQITSIPTSIAFRRGFREVEQLQGDRLTKENIRDWVKRMAERGRQDREPNA